MSSGVSMHAMTRNVSPHTPQCSMVDVEDSVEPLHPAHGRGTRCMRLAGGLMGRFGDDTAAMLEVRGEHAVVSGEMGAGAGYEGGVVSHVVS